MAAAAVLLLLVSAPYVIANHLSGDNYVFGGFLLNPIDGNSYLAKMYQGWQGSWRFRLPYSAEPGPGTFLFLFYLFLGHLARLIQQPLVGVFHAARLVSAVAMALALWAFCRAYLPDRSTRRVGFLLALFGSGLGWLAVPWGAFTMDFWVAEAYPFLSAYANPHFPLGLALLLWFLLPADRGPRRVIALLGGVALAFLLPFAAVLALGILVGMALLPGADRRWSLRRAGWMALGAMVVAGYDLWIVRVQPALAVWNAQNLTPTPPIYDLLLAFSPALPFAMVASLAFLRGRLQQGRIVVVWFVVVAALIYFPYSLQRRLLTGVYVPVAVLGALGLARLTADHPRRFRRMALVLVALSLPTNLVVLLTAWHGASTHAPLLYLAQGEKQALDWIAAHTPADALVLASPEMGMYLPAHTGRRVIYGHPFETVNAEFERAALEDFFRSTGRPDARLRFLVQREVDFLFWGPRERALGGAAPLPEQAIRFQTGDVAVYAVHADLASPELEIVNAPPR